MNKKSFYYFNYFISVNFLFLIFQIIYIISRSNSFLKAIPLPFAVYLEIATALIIQFTLYSLLSLIQTSWIWGINNYTSDKKFLTYAQFAISSLSLIGLLTINCYFFPLSLFSLLFSPLFSPLFIHLSLIIIGLACIILSFNSLALFLKRCSLLTLILIFAVFFLGYRLLIFTQEKTVATINEQSNIIIIGIDSFNPERLSSQQTPHIANFLKDSTHFSETISPLARTYAAWTSILTGLYPVNHQARYNLMPAGLVKSSKSLAWRLRQRGYQTLFATDDRQFSSISYDFGFQDVIGPKLGFNNILLGHFNDFPLSNLLVNFSFSKWLFPYNYLNRGSYFSYYPTSFKQALNNYLVHRSKSQPLLMAVHFTLAHWPYAWATSFPAQQGEYNRQEQRLLYQQALQQADKQIGYLLENLKHSGLLTNSLVILLSDHGEALYELGSRQTRLKLYQGQKKNQLADYFQRKTSTILEKSAGHGSDLLSPSQFHCLLGFKIFKQQRLLNKPQLIPVRVALIDIAPTIYDYLKIAYKTDGISLLGPILNKEAAQKSRTFFLESGELPNQLITKQKARIVGKLLYQVNPFTNALELKPSKLSLLNSLKLYAILKDNWLIALYPDDNYYLTVALRLSDGQWTDEPTSEFGQLTAPLVQTLLLFFKKELADYPKTQPLSSEFSSLLNRLRS